MPPHRSPILYKKGWVVIAITFLYLYKFVLIAAYEAKDFDDSIIYQIEFTDIKPEEDISGFIHEFSMPPIEKYVCHIPEIDDKKEEKLPNDEVSPMALLQTVFKSDSCSFRIDPYWSYEICHGQHVRQYHEEREGKDIKLQEFYLGKWNDGKTVEKMKEWIEQKNYGVKYKTTKIDNVKYPYFEMEYTDGTMCDIINAPRTTLVRYVCYSHGKNEIYSFKEISSCQYEAIILTSALCFIPAFYPEKTKEHTIKCVMPFKKTHKPLSLLMQEMKDFTELDPDVPMPQEAKTVAAVLLQQKLYRDFGKFEASHYKMFLDRMIVKFLGSIQNPIVLNAIETAKLHVNDARKDLRVLLNFINGQNCLTGVTGWWKYEFCYGRYVRQFHKDKNSEVELFLGFFYTEAHKKWVLENPDKAPKMKGTTNHVWHHYFDGTTCDRTNERRVVDVKLTCVANANSPTAVSMYLLEPKTCVYTLVVDSPIVCDLLKYVDEYGLVQAEKLLGKKEPVGGDAESALFRKPPTETDETSSPSSSSSSEAIESTSSNTASITSNSDLDTSDVEPVIV